MPITINTNSRGAPSTPGTPSTIGARSPAKSALKKGTSGAETSRTDTSSVVDDEVMPTAYDGLKAFIESFLPEFEELRQEQIARRKVDEQRIIDTKAMEDALDIRVAAEEQARLDADLSVEKLAQMAIANMYTSVKEPMRKDFANVQSEIDMANDRLTVAMKRLQENVEYSERELKQLKEDVIRGIEVVELNLEEEIKQRGQADEKLAPKYDDQLHALRDVTQVEKDEREADLIFWRKRLLPLESDGEQLNRVAMQQIKAEIEGVEGSIARNHSDRLDHWNVVAHTITEYCDSMSRGLSIVNRSEWDPTPPASVRSEEGEGEDAEGTTD